MINKIDFAITFDQGKEMALTINGMRNLNVMAGANGVGKSLMMQVVWFAGMISSLYKVLLQLKHPAVDKEIQTYIEQLPGLTWDYTNIDLAVSIYSDDIKYRLDIMIKDNKLNYWNADIQDPTLFLEHGVDRVKYNSKDARTFDSFNKYIKLKKKFNKKAIGTLEDMQELGDFFKAYDVMWFEEMEVKMINWSLDGIPDEVKKRFEGLQLMLGDDFNYTRGIFFKDHEFALEKNSTDIKFRSLSSGEQSILMMSLFI